MDPLPIMAEEEEKKEDPALEWNPRDPSSSSSSLSSSSSDVSAILRWYCIPFFPEPVIANAIWVNDLNDKMDLMKNLLISHPFISVQMRYAPSEPRPRLQFLPAAPDDAYAKLIEDLNNAQPMQLILTFSDSAGNVFKHLDDNGREFVMQFNLAFAEKLSEVDAEIKEEMELQGTDVEKFVNNGIHRMHLAFFMWMTMPVFKSSLRWLSYDPAMDLGALLKMVRVTQSTLPETRRHFLQLITMYFPTFYDVRHLTEISELAGGSLRDAVEEVGLSESDDNWLDGKPESLLTMERFWKLASFFPSGNVPKEHTNLISGLGRR